MPNARVSTLDALSFERWQDKTEWHTFDIRWRERSMENLKNQNAIGPLARSGFYLDNRDSSSVECCSCKSRLKLSSFSDNGQVDDHLIAEQHRLLDKECPCLLVSQWTNMYVADLMPLIEYNGISRLRGVKREVKSKIRTLIDLL
ncbi:hypothetical protein ACOME3_007628 [Neoechinorhynchus agilis]